jgi:hypothetical protein
MDSVRIEIFNYLYGLPCGKKAADNLINDNTELAIIMLCKELKDEKDNNKNEFNKKIAELESWIKHLVNKPKSKKRR